MQILRSGNALYVGHVGVTGIGTSILDVSELDSPRLVRQLPAPEGSISKKVQVGNGHLLINFESPKGKPTGSVVGMGVYSLEDPFDPRPVGFWDSGGEGVHRMVWEGGRYAFVSARPPDVTERIWMILDLSDLSAPHEVGRWWWPGQARGEQPGSPEGAEYKAHHALIDGDRAFLGYLDAGMVILDISDVSSPRLVSASKWPGSRHTHTCMPLPGRNIVVATDEPIRLQSEEGVRLVHIVDVTNEAHPTLISTCPPPRLGGPFSNTDRLGPHNLNENRKDGYQSLEIVFVTYFAAGLRVYDLADAEHPEEIAHWMPHDARVQINDIFVDNECRIYISDRVGGGAYILRPEPWLEQRMERARLP